MQELIRAVDADRFNLIIKLHPNTKLKCQKESNVSECRGFSELQLLSVADYVITDYSAASFEAAAYNLPLYFYTYDLAQYKKNPGLNVDLRREFPGFVFDNANKLMECLGKDKYPKELVKDYAKKYISYLDTKNTKRLAKIILKEMDYA